MEVEVVPSGTVPRARPDQTNPDPSRGNGGAAARHPSARTLTEAAFGAGLTPGDQPARGNIVTTIAVQARAAVAAATREPMGGINIGAFPDGDANGVSPVPPSNAPCGGKS